MNRKKLRKSKDKSLKDHLNKIKKKTLKTVSNPFRWLQESLALLKQSVKIWDILNSTNNLNCILVTFRFWNYTYTKNKQVNKQHSFTHMNGGRNVDSTFWGWRTLTWRRRTSWRSQRDDRRSWLRWDCSASWQRPPTS